MFVPVPGGKLERPHLILTSRVDVGAVLVELFAHLKISGFDRVVECCVAPLVGLVAKSPPLVLGEALKGTFELIKLFRPFILVSSTLE